MAARHRLPGRREDPRQHGDRPQRPARPVGLDARPEDPLEHLGLGPRLAARSSGSAPTTCSTTRTRTSSARTTTSATGSCASTRTSPGSRATSCSRCGTSSTRASSSTASRCTTSSSASTCARSAASPPSCGPGSGRRSTRSASRSPRTTCCPPAALRPGRGGSTLAANLTANVVRNLWSHSVIMCGHFPEGVETFEQESSTRTRPRASGTSARCSARRTSPAARSMHLMSGNLSHQIEHHLFPDLPSNRYYEIAPRVRDAVPALRAQLPRARRWPSRSAAPGTRSSGSPCPTAGWRRRPGRTPRAGGEAVPRAAEPTRGAGPPPVGPARTADRRRPLTDPTSSGVGDLDPHRGRVARPPGPGPPAAGPEPASHGSCAARRDPGQPRVVEDRLHGARGRPRSHQRLEARLEDPGGVVGGRLVGRRGPGCPGAGRTAAGSGRRPWCVPARAAGRPCARRARRPRAGRPRSRPCAPAARPSAPGTRDRRGEARRRRPARRTTRSNGSARRGGRAVAGAGRERAGRHVVRRRPWPLSKLSNHRSHPAGRDEHGASRDAVRR